MTGWFSGLRGAKRLPDCTGPFAVGCTDYMCAKTDILHTVDNQHGSFVRLFYPTKKPDLDQNELLKRQTTWFPRSEYSKGVAGFVNLPAWLFGAVVHWTINHVRIPAIQNAPLLLSTSEGKGFPCIVFSHGLGANRLMYSTYCCELASQGCVVAIVEHRDKSASATYVLKENEGQEKVEDWIPFYKRGPRDDEFQLRNTQVKQRQDECISAFNILEQLNKGTIPENLLMNQEFDLGQFKGRLDLQKTAIVGHSFGGATTVGTLARDKRFRCGVALDVWMMPLGNEIHDQEINQPLFFINTYQFHKWKENVKELKKLVQGKPETRPVIAVRSTSHMSQSDIVFVLSHYLSWFTTWRSHQLDSFTADRLYKKAMWAFLCRHLDIGNPPERHPLLDGGDDLPEHVIMGFEEKNDSAQL